MDAMKVFCFVFALLGVLAGVSDAIKCYTCNSLHTKNCKDEFKKEGVTVQDNCKECMKIKMEKDGNQFFIRRTCYEGHEDMPINIGRDECKEEKKDGNEANLCMCEKDLCNGAPLVAVTFLSLVTAVLIRLNLM